MSFTCCFRFFLFLYTSLLFFTFSPSTSASQSELRSLLEFKKGISSDPLNKILSTWNFSSLPDLNTCPAAWPGIACDPTTDLITAISLDRLSLSGDLKFSTLLNLKSLQNLSLSGNRFTGRIVPALGSVSSLQYLDLSDNNFSGPIPGRIAELWNLKYVNLSRNGFEGGFPVGLPVPFRNLQQLKVLDLRSNKFGGNVGEVLSELINLEHLDLSDNVFYGQLDGLSAENVSGLANTVRFVNFSGNKLNGGFLKEEVIGLFRNLEVLDLSDNGINGELPSLGSLLSLRVLRLKNNELFGGIPEELLNGSMPIEELDLSGNGFTGSIHGINSTTLNTLILSSNGISGSLPAFLKRCTVIDLSRNMISSDLSVMQNWEASIEILDLSSNMLSGSLPNLASQFPRLSKLSLRNNSLEGNLPPQWGASSGLSAIDLSLNQLSGTIPSGFFTSMALTNLNLSRNQFTGPIPLQGSHVGELLVLPSYPKIDSLDLSHNSLSGGLVSDIGNMASLKLLNLSNNDLSGELPIELSKLTYLQYLDLSGNKFKGKIPDQLPSSLIGFNVSYNDLSGVVPKNLRKFGISSFQPGNSLLIFLNGGSSTNSVPDELPVQGRHHGPKHRVTIGIIIGAVVTIAILVFLAYHRAQQKDFHGRSDFSGQTTREHGKVEPSARSSLFKFQSNVHRPPTSLSFSNDHLLTTNSRSLSGQTEFGNEIVEHDLPGGVAVGSAPPNLNVIENCPTTSGRKSSPGSPLTSSPRFIEPREQCVKLDVYSPDRLAGELFFLDASLAFTAEELSRAPAEVLGRSSHGTLYKATLDGGHMLTVKWLRVGLVKHKKEFAKEVKRIGSVRHPNIVPLRAYYWGPREQERLLLADYIHGDSLALHLYESTPRRYSLLSFSQRLKVAIDVARCLLYIHDRGMLHGNLKPTNILLEGPEYNVRLTDYGLHRLMTPSGIAEQILNLGALGYCAPELANASKPAPSFKADVYAFGVILMELLTRRSAGDIISGQSGAVDLPDWVRLCDQEGRRMDCIDRDIAGGEEPIQAMDDLLALSLRCILPVNERPNIRQVLEDLCSISV
ncbi:probable inactive receptor kinase At5g10020 [Ricinus communis]|uniref:probable inactive receptor kinase At5g10020 n=1 Tax=Ricinus communis TaxID=3988 RepID=UPI00201ABD68|nr:probable inactive receptor kinase At5g10020 [Ricinus communis]